MEIPTKQEYEKLLYRILKMHRHYGFTPRDILVFCIDCIYIKPRPFVVDDLKESRRVEK